MTGLLTAVAGWSIGMAILLAVALLTAFRDQPWPIWAKAAGLVMLAGLAHTAWGNIGLANLPAGAEPPARYGWVLFAQSLGFYLLLRGLLAPAVGATRGLVVLGVAALVAAIVTPASRAIPVAMMIGVAYSTHLAVLLWRLRPTRRWFRIELPVVLLFGAMGAAAAVAGWLAPQWLAWPQFALVYSLQIAAAFLLVGWLLLAVPDLVAKTQEAVFASYSQSTLGKVDVDRAAERLRQAFEDEHVYRDECLSLAKVAGLVELSTHQLSEMLNARFGISFSRYVRQYRVAAARRMLPDEPKASVLSVGLSVGFGSQSTFYVAFKDEVGVVPGEFRKRELGSAASP